LQNNIVRILFFGDVVGPLGRTGVKDYLSFHKEKDGIDFVIANGENATHGHGLSYDHYKQLLSYGVDVVTNGNHLFNCKDALEPKLNFSNAVRPYNLDVDCPGVGTKVFEFNNIKIRVTNLLGRVFISMAQSNPFYDIDKIIAEDDSDIHIIDFHAEATAEKRCFAEYVDGRVSAVFGTHTHVQTNDLKTLNKGTLFISDVGMNGAYDSVLGFDKYGSIRRTSTGMPSEMEVNRKGKILINAILFDVNIESKKVEKFKLINEIEEFGL
jgi:metallophosphoesterase (TIGR00282 family)